jgi:hypothetical protein
LERWNLTSIENIKINYDFEFAGINIAHPAIQNKAPRGGIIPKLLIPVMDKIYKLPENKRIPIPMLILALHIHLGFGTEFSVTANTSITIV